MAINSLRAVFFVIGALVVAGGAAYVTGALDIFLPQRQTAIASLPSSQPVTAPAPAVAPEPSRPEAAVPPVAGPAAPAVEEAVKPQETAPEVIIPSFDLVRVEPDGSLVIAGRAAPISTVEIVSGARTIGSGEANATGEFAIVLDDPLKPGDYTLVLRSTTRDAIVATSTETAIVSIPETQQGQVLALVEQPGAPSRLITVPEPAAEKGDRPAAQEPAAAGTQPVEEPAETAAQTAAAPMAQEPQAAPATGEAAQEEQTLAGAPAAEPQAPEALQPQAEAPAAGPPQVAAVAEPKAQEQAVAPAEKARIAVEAVEIEGRKVYVAGRAESGARVRVYANEIFLGETKTSDGGRFLVEAERDLPVGDYIVRADMLGPNSQVLARAAVPFQREPGESIAAVAPQEQPAAPKPAEPVAQVKPAEGPLAAEAPKPAEAEPAVAAAEPATGGQPAAETGGEPVQEVAEVPVEPAAPAETQPQEVTAAKLESVAGAVIIRRGDTLWRISKRVYGRGVRYTTIYLANQGQIEDPDRIWPGQVFAVPGKTDGGEDADMSAVADRLAPEGSETR